MDYEEIPRRRFLMETPICPACGCSLVRLGTRKDEAPAYRYGGEEYLFCCEGCIDVFKTAPEEYLREVSGVAVCPVCLAEKRVEATVELEHEGEILHFCRCPHCREEFGKNPERFVGRLAG
jgi:YHS domain-containing protein